MSSSSGTANKLMVVAGVFGMGVDIIEGAVGAKEAVNVSGNDSKERL